MKISVLRILPFLACGVAAGQVSGAVIATEAFNYPSNLGSSINGLNSGSGWSGGWQDGDADVTLASANASLTYPAGTGLSPSGTRIALTTADATATAIRTLATPLDLAPNNTFYYASALFRRSSTAGASSAVDFVRSSDSITRFSFGITALGEFYVAVDPNNAGQITKSTALAQADSTYLLVAKLRTNTAPGTPLEDEVFLEVFGPGDTVGFEPADAGWDLREQGNSGVMLNQVRLSMANGDGQTNQFDELRLGSTWQDVTGAVPEPTSLAGLVLGSGLLLRRKRRPA